MEPGLFDHRRMAKSPRKPPAIAEKRPTERIPLYVSEWIARLGRRPGEVAKGAGIGESYISLLGSQKRDQPTPTVLFALADELGIKVDDFRHPPPPQSAIASIEQLSPAARAVLFGDRDRDQ